MAESDTTSLHKPEKSADKNGKDKTAGSDTKESKYKVTKEGRLPVIATKPGQGIPILLHVEDDALDFSGDSGAIGRLNVHDSSLMIDLKGKQFNTQFFPTRGTMMILTAGSNDIKIDTVVNECGKMHYIGSIFETMDVLKGEMVEDGDDLGSDEENKSTAGEDGKSKKDSSSGKSGTKKKKGAASSKGAAAKKKKRKSAG
mmetsp:Transcript_6598/g.9835  ORF Transcript_6598/g.9835 Transcript_6598/m.9835 type:complete len:200 (-) Transcript_6598:185-784(-)